MRMELLYLMIKHNPGRHETSYVITLVRTMLVKAGVDKIEFRTMYLDNNNLVLSNISILGNSIMKIL